jgi:hypothetical protein
VVPTASLLAALEAADALRALLVDSRPLLPADLAPVGAAPLAVIDPTGLTQTGDRLDTLAGTLTTLHTTLAAAGIGTAAVTAAALVDTLLAADRLGVEEAAPVAALTGIGSTDLAGPPSADLVTLARATAAALQTRLNAEADLTPPAGGDPTTTVGWLRERARALGGVTFWLAPALTALDGTSDPLAGAEPAGVTPEAASRVVAQYAAVRPGVARLDRVLAATEALHGTAPAAVVCQRPLAPGERWVALPPDPGGRISGGRTATLAMVPVTPTATTAANPVAALMVDEWVEVVPNREETTSLAFHYDAPSSAAPNVLLLGVPRLGWEQWSTPKALDVVDEALALARLRTVDPDQLAAAVGPLLPGLYTREHDTPGTVAALQAGDLTRPRPPS